MDLLEFAEKCSAELKTDADPKGVNDHAPEEQNISIKIAEPKKCYACSSIEGWWRKKGSSGRWICSECHPPAITKNEVAFRSNF
jgi:hypothetical protein